MHGNLCSILYILFYCTQENSACQRSVSAPYRIHFNQPAERTDAPCRRTVRTNNTRALTIMMWWTNAFPPPPPIRCPHFHRVLSLRACVIHNRTRNQYIMPNCLSMFCCCTRLRRAGRPAYTMNLARTRTRPKHAPTKPSPKCVRNTERI